MAQYNNNNDNAITWSSVKATRFNNEGDPEYVPSLFVQYKNIYPEILIFEDK